MKMQMLVTDLDNTLLRGDKTISGYTASVFQRCRARGMKIVFATARPARTTVDFVKAIPPDAMIENNGGGIFVGGQVIQRRDVPPQAVTAITEKLLAVQGVRLSFDYGSHSLTNCEDHPSWGHWNFVFSDFSECNPCGVRKISIQAADPSLLACVDFTALGCHIYSNQGENWYMVQEKSATKGSAVAAVAEHFGIALRDAAAFGDDHNDVGMLRACGMGVAVANAIGEAKAAADLICGSNEDDGPARWIEEHIL